MKNNARIFKTLAVIAALMLLAAAHLRAGSATWLNSPLDNNWNKPINWTSGGPPNGPADIATFGQSNSLSPFLAADTEVNAIVFTAAATSVYGITASPTFVLTISGAGITNNSGSTKFFTTEVNGAGAFGLISFFNMATVGNLITFNNRGAMVNTLGAFGGITRFANSSNAGSGRFLNNGGGASDAFGGSTIFFDSAKAGSGDFTNNGGSTGALGGSTVFNGDSSAEDATFRNNFSTNFGRAGFTRFNNTSDAGTGDFSNIGSSGGPVEGGLTQFFNTSDANSGFFTNFGATGADGRAGLTQFNDDSSAKDGAFSSRGGTADNAVGGLTQFNGTTDAGSGSFTNDGGGTASFAGGGSTIFNDDSTAEDGTFTNKGSSASAKGGRTAFFNTSDAGTGEFINDASLGFGAGAGLTEFNDDSSANGGTFSNKGASMVANGGGTLFHDTSDAGSGIFTNDGATIDNFNAYGGGVQFNDDSDADRASLIANGGVNGGRGGVIVFNDNSSGGNSRVQVFGNGYLDISFHNAPGVTIGSIEGDGEVVVGVNILTVGSNNVSTTFAGLIRDGDDVVGTGGSLAKIGTGTLILSDANTYTGGTTVTAGRLLANNTTGSGTGGGAVTVSNSGSALGGTGTISGPVTVNSGAILSGGNATTASGSLKVANNVTLNSGAVIELGLGPSGAHSTLSRTAGTWTFASNQAFAFINLGAQPGTYDNIITGLAGDPGGTASWTITTSGFTGTFSYDGAGNIDLNITAAPNPIPGALANISSRLRVETGDNVLIGGIIITGTQPKRVILRAIGPSLSVADKLSDPFLQLHNSSGALLEANDNWVESPNKQAIIDSNLAPTNNFESAIVRTLAPGDYTAIVLGVNNGTGVGLVEAYDLDSGADSELANISTRGFVQTGDNVLIAGMIGVVGQSPQNVIIRALGPSVPVPGRMADPTLELRDSNGALLEANDNWVDSANKQAIIDSTIPPPNALESAIVRALPAAAYTAIVRGVNNTLGIAVVEVYALP